MQCFRSGGLSRAVRGMCVVAFVAQPILAHAADTTVTETGSTLMHPLMQSWAAAYSKAAPGVNIETAGTDSGEGIKAAIAGSVQLGASDAYMSDVEKLRHPDILNIPLAISAQTVNYNLPRSNTPLMLSGPVIAGIYKGEIRNWNDKRIAALNAGVALPDHAIVAIRRSDASGDTFIFTQFLTFSDPAWENSPGFGTTVAWPDVPGSLTAAGNPEMVATLAKTPFGIAYIGDSFADAIASAKLGTAELLNESGKFVLPTPRTITAAAESLTPRTPADERLTLAFAPGDDSYPLINYEYAIVAKNQPNPDMAAAIRDFLVWAVSPDQGSSAAYLDPVHFIPLPTAIRGLTEIQITKLH